VTQCHTAGIFLLKGDEAGVWYGKRLKVKEKLIYFDVVLLHSIEALESDLVASVL